MHLRQLLTKERAPYVLLVLVLVCIEVFFAVYTGNRYDMDVWFHTGEWMSSGINIYLPADHLGYPPLWALWCLAAYNIYGLFGNVEIWRLAIKLPLILGQFAITYAVWHFAKSRFDAQTTKKLALYTLTCSFFIYISVLWGQINILSALCTFLAFYAVVTKRFGLGAVLLGVAVTLKINPIVALPAFMLYIYKNRNIKETAKFTVITAAVPILFTLAVFAAYSWDILYFLKTIFYWAPVYDANPVQFGGGCMNIWSFLALYRIEISQITILRFIWIPIMAAAAFLWFKKKTMKEADLSLAIVSFYFLFMISYSWVSEQTFLDTLPFIFLFVFAYKPKPTYLYGLIVVQILIFTFSLVNGGSAIFQPLFEKYNPAIVGPAQELSSNSSWLIWNIRGILGLIVSIALALFLVALTNPNLDKAKQKINQALHRKQAAALTQ